VQQRAASALETVSHAIGASQRVMHNLRPAILEQGLVAALQWLAGRFEKRTGIECLFRTSHEHIGSPKATNCRPACRWWPTAPRRRR
jgi:signal transduction histidine kinase